MESSNLILMIEVPSWGRQLLSLFSRSSFEQWAGMSFQTALQLKPIQRSLRESWVLGHERHYGSPRSSFNRKMSALVQPINSQVQAPEHPHHVGNQLQIAQKKLIAGQNQLFYSTPTAYPVNYGQNAALDKQAPMEEGQELPSPTVMESLLKLRSERTDSPKTGLESKYGTQVQTQDRYFASKPDLPHDVSSHYYTGNAVADLQASENLKMAIERALSQASVVAQSRIRQKKTNNKKYLYLAPWLQQRA